MVGRSFIGPYILSFIIAEFVLVMQFLWKYIDDIMGKGIGFFEIMELVLYFAGTIIPKAIPISILLSSVFVFGNMAEKFELTSLKSSGIPLTRILRMGMIFAIGTAFFSLFAANVIVPKANYQFFSRFDVIKKQKPTYTLEEKVFNKDFTGYNIYFKEKDPDGKTVYNVMIYDELNSSNYRDFNIVIAQKGIMSTSADGNYFIMNLFDGEQYRKSKQKKSLQNQEENMPFIRTKYKTYEKVFPLAEFDIDNGIFYPQRRKYDFMNTLQLFSAIDSVDREIVIKTKENVNNFEGILHSENLATEKTEKEKESEEMEALASTVKKKDNVPSENARKALIMARPKQKPESEWGSTLLSTFEENNQKSLIANTIVLVKQKKDQLLNNHSRIREKDRRKQAITLVLHKMYSWAFICIIFLFIGAPFGSIIRKGGFGYPLLMAIIFFMIFIILSIIGEKLHQSQALGPIVGAWLPCLILAPVAVYLTIKALNDEKLVNVGLISNIVNKLRPYSSSS